MNTKRIKELADQVGKLTADKNVAYGSSFSKSSDFLKILYPDGVKPEQYEDVLLLARIFDKLMRIAHDKGAFGESPYIDIAGYALLGAIKDEVKSSTDSGGAAGMHRVSFEGNEPPEYIRAAVARNHARTSGGPVPEENGRCIR